MEKSSTAPEPSGSSACCRPSKKIPGRTGFNPLDPIPLATAKLLAPVVPRKIVCIGRNYREHAAELGNEVPKEPLLFLKAPSSVIAPEQTIRIPEQSQRVDFEGELAVVIGRRASHIAPDDPSRRTSAATPSSTTSPPATCRNPTASGPAPRASTPSARLARS